MKPRRQFGAIPFRRGADGQLLVLLLTSRETRRWVIPKGWPMPHRTGAEVAAQEAYEEAGVRGHIMAGGRPLGRYIYQKRLSAAKSIPCAVTIYRLKVLLELAEWPEHGQRERRWVLASEATTMVEEPELRLLRRRLAAMARVVEPIGIEPTTS